MTVSVASAVLAGIDAALITVETRVCAGLGYLIVGLPGDAVKESLFRVESALSSVGLVMPRQKILVCLAPAGIRKEGAAFDLPIALSILAASDQLSEETLRDYVFTGELSLAGKLRPIKGALSVAIEAHKRGYKRLVLPKENAAEAAMVSDLAVFGFETLDEVVEFLTAPNTVARERVPAFKKDEGVWYSADFADVRGQAEVKRALEIMAAGGHNGLLVGPPGTGKTMLAARLPGILPPLSLTEALETTRIYSAAGQLDSAGLMTQRPFRAVHHTASDIALVGGGPVALPGEISLAHHGVLFLDELTEFKRKTLEVLRQPLEERQVVVSRASYSVVFPANFVLLAAMNPCPCGFYKHPTRRCTCTPMAVRNYLSKISGPLLDRIDLHVGVRPADMSAKSAENSADVRSRVTAARVIQLERAGCPNALLSAAMVKRFCALGKTEETVLQQAMVQHKLSARSYERILKVARTIADLDQSKTIKLSHLAEAIGYRCFSI
ncbi:YifB family Mg chelatase-like AAA ATPase [Mucilaginibacter segetis]|uniref:YifB family Mg chelatase-like AAA ATPase n=1 Tax=Mucilaginibacter segetis TaxID=2793071 RepID=A0A934PTP1_9SPHI|nr:YifB family Mg chelatase-like AAA ATPase [Mucilaginibacter segetis]MBK0379362.1 YifB family Mg chelatase-like AAA ATPase [Mucilaginibacter segetis]